MLDIVTTKVNRLVQAQRCSLPQSIQNILVISSDIFRSHL